ncbi:MAG TPA: hypothetical protein VHX86_17020 [Tepidisphaeraceae bacterium]|jgi:hypothetical protein|nr:hypothetical protein [Tepidisphaeraceae bacterium]
MKNAAGIFVFVLISSIAAAAPLAVAQANRPNNQPQAQPQPHPALTKTDLLLEVRQFATDLDDPNYDYSKVPARMRQVFTDMRGITDGMDPDQVRELRTQLFQEIRPALERNQAKIQKAMQMAFLKELQEPLGASDDEFSAIEPLLEKVVDAQREADGGMARFRRFGRPPGQNNSQNSQQQLSPVDQATENLQTVLDDPNSSGDQIKARLDTLRQAKSKAVQDLSVARDALRAVLTVRQEAVLVDRGILD